MVEFDLTPEEWVDVAVEHNRHTPLLRKAVRDARRAFGALVAVVGLLGMLGGYDVFAMAWLFAGATGVVLLPRLFDRSQRRQYETFARDGIANGMFGTHRVHLREDGILDETDAYERLTRWHAVERVEEGPGSFMIYFGKNAFLPIPHSAFRDSETLRAFGDRFFDRIGSADEIARAEGAPDATGGGR